jgi:hypothetical protein
MRVASGLGGRRRLCAGRFPSSDREVCRSWEVSRGGPAAVKLDAQMAKRK